jgi:hypothetical protein
VQESIEGTFFPEGTLLRIDDVSVNLDLDRLTKFLELVRSKYQKVTILLAVSPMVFNMDKWEPNNESTKERVFPAILNAMSDHRVYFNVEKIGIPVWLNDVAEKYECILATHGLIHVDHRLLTKDLQELSVISSASLVGTRIFVPPFNKYNDDTVAICNKNKIELVRWEDGWTHLGYHPFSDNGKKYYVHLHDYPGEKLFSFFQ